MSARCTTHTVCGGGLSLRRHPLPLGQAAALRAGSPRESRTGASQSGETPLPPPLLRPASPIRFVIFLLGLLRRQLAPDLSNAQFTLSATKPTELVSIRTLYNSHGLWGEVLFALVRGSAPKASPCWELGLRHRPLGQAAEARRATTYLARGGRGGKIVKRKPFRFPISRRGSWDF